MLGEGDGYGMLLPEFKTQKSNEYECFLGAALPVVGAGAGAESGLIADFLLEFMAAWLWEEAC